MRTAAAGRREAKRHPPQAGQAQLVVASELHTRESPPVGDPHQQQAPAAVGTTSRELAPMAFNLFGRPRNPPKGGAPKATQAKQQSAAEAIQELSKVISMMEKR